MFNQNDLTDLEQCIMETARRNPNMSKEQIADHCDCSNSYVRQTLEKYGDPKDGSNMFGLNL